MRDYALQASLRGTISFQSISYDIQTNNIVFRDVTITVDGSTLQLNTLSIPAADVINFLPSGVDVYSFNILSPYTIMHNSSSPHAIAMYRGQLIEAAYRQCSIDSDSVFNGSSTTTNSLRGRRKLTHFKFPPAPMYLAKNHPLPVTARQSLEIQVILALFASIFILVPLCYVPAIFCNFIVLERSSKCKHLQIVSGMSPHVYWTGTYLWDLFQYLILAIFVMLSLLIYSKDAAVVFISSSESALAVICLLLTYGSSSIALSYLYSLAFTNHSTAQISIMSAHFFTGTKLLPALSHMTIMNARIYLCVGLLYFGINSEDCEIRTPSRPLLSLLSSL